MHVHFAVNATILTKYLKENAFNKTVIIVWSNLMYFIVRIAVAIVTVIVHKWTSIYARFANLKNQKKIIIKWCAVVFRLKKLIKEKLNNRIIRILMININVKFACLINWKWCLRIVAMVRNILFFLLINKKSVHAFNAQMIWKRKNVRFVEKKVHLKRFLFERFVCCY